MLRTKYIRLGNMVKIVPQIYSHLFFMKDWISKIPLLIKGNTNVAEAEMDIPANKSKNSKKKKSC